MKKTSETVVFFGSGPVAAASLGEIAKHLTVEGVITKATPPHHKDPAPVEVLARSLRLPIHLANNKGELDELIDKHKFSSDVGIIVDYGVIVSQAVIDSFKLGIVNSHFSLLPEWRGADPITFSILSGQKKTGVSLMLIEPTLDTGKLLTQKSINIGPDETTPSLTKKLTKLSNELLVEYLPRFISGDIKPRQQPHPDRATYSRKLTKDDGLLDWGKPAVQLEREIRAFIEWPKSRTRILGKEVIITKATVASGTEKNQEPGDVMVTKQPPALGIVTAEGTLWIQMIKPIGKQEMSDAAFIRGYVR